MNLPGQGLRQNLVEECTIFRPQYWFSDRKVLLVGSIKYELAGNQKQDWEKNIKPEGLTGALSSTIQDLAFLKCLC